MLELIENFLKEIKAIYKSEKDIMHQNKINLKYYRYLFQVNEEECEILFADNETIYMSAGFYDERVICDENEKLIESLERLKELIKKRRLEC